MNRSKLIKIITTYPLSPLILLGLIYKLKLLLIILYKRITFFADLLSTVSQPEDFTKRERVNMLLFIQRSLFNLWELAFEQGRKQFPSAFLSLLIFQLIASTTISHPLPVPRDSILQDLSHRPAQNRFLSQEWIEKEISIKIFFRQLSIKAF